MVITDKEFCDAVHLNIHAVRLIPNYKPSLLDKKISKLVIEKFMLTCKDCKEIEMKMRYAPEEKESSFLKRIGGSFNA